MNDAYANNVDIKPHKKRKSQCYGMNVGMYIMPTSQLAEPAISHQKEPYVTEPLSGFLYQHSTEVYAYLFSNLVHVKLERRKLFVEQYNYYSQWNSNPSLFEICYNINWSLIKSGNIGWINFHNPRSSLELTGGTSIPPNKEPCDAYLVDVILNRKHRFNKTEQNKHEFDDPPIIIKCFKHETTDEYDQLFRCLIIVYPSSGVFFSPYARSSNGNNLPLPISWLRMKVASGLPAQGSYIRRIVEAYPIRLAQHEYKSYITKKLHGLQIHDQNPIAPLLPPSMFLGEHLEATINNSVDDRTRYRRELNKSHSYRKGARRYVRSAFHTGHPTGAFVVDPRLFGNASFTISIESYDARGKKGVLCTSSIIVADAGTLDADLVSALTCATPIIEKSPGIARGNAGDMGSMKLIGETVDQNGSRYSETKVTLCNTKNRASIMNDINIRASVFASKYLPSLKATTLSLLDTTNVVPCHAMGGPNGFVTSMSYSTDLGNASHYDVHDASQGFTIWTEDKPGCASDWYLLMPNIQINVEDHEYNGLAVHLFHGCMISWDGRYIRHATSVTNLGCTDNHTHGWFWGASNRTFQYHMKSESNTKSADSNQAPTKTDPVHTEKDHDNDRSHSDTALTKRKLRIQIKVKDIVPSNNTK